MSYDGGLELAYDVSVAIRRAFVDGPNRVSLVRPGLKISVVQDGERLTLRNSEGPASTVWHTQIPMPDVHTYLAHFFHLIDLDEWDRETIPKRRAQLLPMRVETEWQAGRPKWADATIGKGKRERSVWRNPPVQESPHQYTAAWSFLQSIGALPFGVPVQGYEGILERSNPDGLDTRRLRAVR